MIYLELVAYQVVMHLSPTACTGFLIGWCLLLQLLGGIVISVYWDGGIELAYDSLQLLMRDYRHIWLPRFIHANTVNVLMVLITLHVFKAASKCQGSSRTVVWWLGVVLMVAFMGIAFSGYSLIVGQMAYWALTVICNLVTSIPWGQDLLHYIWGQSTVGTPMIRRCFCIHFLAPFIVTFIAILHIAHVHTLKSTEEYLANRSTVIYWRPFVLSFGVKDLTYAHYCILWIAILALWEPWLLLDPDNYLKAEMFKTPKHIVPEWYLLPWYGILRTIPSKIGGLLGMLYGITSIGSVTWRRSSIQWSSNPHYRVRLWSMLWTLTILAILATLPTDWPVVPSGTLPTTLLLLHGPP